MITHVRYGSLALPSQNLPYLSAREMISFVAEIRGRGDVEWALALTGLNSGFFISNFTSEEFFIRAPCQFLGLKGLIGVNAKMSELRGIIGPFADKL